MILTDWIAVKYNLNSLLFPTGTPRPSIRLGRTTFAASRSLTTAGAWTLVIIVIRFLLVFATFAVSAIIVVVIFRLAFGGLSLPFGFFLTTDIRL